MIAKTVRKSVMWPRSQSFFAFWKFQLLYFSFLPTICCIIIIFIANVMQNVEIYNWYCHSEFRKTVPTQQQQKCTTQYLSSGFPGGCNLRIFLSQYISAILQYYISAIPSTEYQRNIIHSFIIIRNIHNISEQILSPCVSTIGNFFWRMHLSLLKYWILSQYQPNVWVQYNPSCRMLGT